MRGSGHPQLEVRRTMIPLEARWSFNKAPKRFNLVCVLSISRYNAGNEPSPRDRRGQASSLLLVVHVSDNVGDVLVAFLLLLDEGGVVQARVLDLFPGFFLGFLGASDHIAIGGHLALGFRVRFLERHEFGIGDFWRHDFFFSCGLDCARRGGGIGARAWPEDANERTRTRQPSRSCGAYWRENQSPPAPPRLSRHWKSESA